MISENRPVQNTNEIESLIIYRMQLRTMKLLKSENCMQPKG